ncbi:MAG: exodeoxyribonuclease VII small subunit [Candidatus Eisenbacteria bacterium]|uniref:Exodeoxyribonuclease 7 small subunit n=1 Tax=Eiseniibacteriota bacterium TaxID=2212470 RepID=A0A538TZ06_UNCEI|nr:MAG: exodeoxyribonuclease VII small subunit [Candidatus Eisenbacteria bacterium]
MAQRKSAPRPAGDEPDGFEASLARLEVIVQELEGGTLTLEESLARYEEGMRLSQRLTQTLDQAEQRIETLNAEPEAPHAPSDETGEGPARGARSGEGELPL